MFEFDAGKLIIIGIVALIVIGPKELPRVMRQVGQAVAKLRRLGAEFQAQFTEAMREADAEELKTHMRELTESAKIDLGGNPLAIANAELTAALEKPIGASEQVGEQQPAPGAMTGSGEPATTEAALPARSAAPQA
jgi:sec-independent protein translocase protein TatB